MNNYSQIKNFVIYDFRSFRKISHNVTNYVNEFKMDLKNRKTKNPRDH